MKYSARSRAAIAYEAEAGMKRKGPPGVSQINRSGSSFLYATTTQQPYLRT